MAITTDEVTAAVDAAFTDVNEFAMMLKMLAGVGVRVKLEIQRDETFRKIQAVQADLQARQQSRQTENVADSQQTEAEVGALQQQAQQLQAQIDAINAQLPDLLK